MTPGKRTSAKASSISAPRSATWSQRRPASIAVGGLSGTGKTTLAASLAPLIGSAPGAVHLRSDLERKALAGVGETARLPVEAYTSEARTRIYQVLCERARLVLAAGHSVIVDAVFAEAGERDAVARVAAEPGRQIPRALAGSGPGQAHRPCRSAPQRRLRRHARHRTRPAAIGSRRPLLGVDRSRCRRHRAGDLARGNRGARHCPGRTARDHPA